MSPSTQRQSWLWVWFVVIFILGIWFWKVYSDSKALRPPVTPVTETPTTTTTLTISPQDPNIGNPQASLVLVELADFECPYCAEAAPILEQFAQDNPNSVRLVWKDFIIPNHSNSLPAAIAAQCAARERARLNVRRPSAPVEPPGDGAARGRNVVQRDRDLHHS